MNKATISKPQVSSTYSTNTVSDSGYTYNQATFSYNQAGVTYGGADRKSAPAPKNYKSKVI